MNKPALVKRSVRIAGHATSVSLEAAFWAALREIAARREVSVSVLLAAIDAERSGNLSSAIRLFVLECCRRGELRDVPAAAPLSGGVARAERAHHSGAQHIGLRKHEGG